MNSVSINGYTLSKNEYKRNLELDEMEYKFFVKVYDPISNETKSIPCKALGVLADRCAIELSYACYVEIVGHLSVSSSGKAFVFCRDITYKKPKSRTEVHIKASEFLQAYKPINIQERVKKGTSNES